ncbi:MAG: hypothetical protein KFF49_05905 [Bacteroidales bacterium]|nr:hypothetical protein [Bacteroidales bacterium]
MKELDRIIGHLRLFEPQIPEKESLKNKIMEKAGIGKEKSDYFFGWTKIVWLRRSLAVASVLITGIFIGQHLLLVNRINDLEKRMIGFNTEKILEYQRQNVLINAKIIKDYGLSLHPDSIKVSTGDLLNLINEYRELKTKYENLTGGALNKSIDQNKQKL